MKNIATLAAASLLAMTSVALAGGPGTSNVEKEPEKPAVIVPSSAPGVGSLGAGGAAAAAVVAAAALAAALAGDDTTTTTTTASN
jgi:hypothetical protein